MSERFPDDESRFTDPIDKASHLADLHNASNVALARAKAAPEQDGTVTECEDCGEPIEPERIKHLRCRCFSCQSLKEERKRRGLG